MSKNSCITSYNRKPVNSVEKMIDGVFSSKKKNTCIESYALNTLNVISYFKLF